MTERHVFVERNRRRVFFCRDFDSLRYIDTTFSSKQRQNKSLSLVTRFFISVLTMDNKLRYSFSSMTQKSKPLAGLSLLFHGLAAERSFD